MQRHQNSPKLSICIPTFNRAKHLAVCLQSIADNLSAESGDFEICVSDNGSSDLSTQVVTAAMQTRPINYHRNPKNLGIPRNFLNVVSMARGEFVWLVGDDDLLTPKAISTVCKLIEEHPEVDYFYINAAHLTTEYLSDFPSPFSTSNLPKDIRPFSGMGESKRMKFLELIDPSVSFDFLGGMFLAVFRRQMWLDNAHVLDAAAITDMRTFSHFDNTFPHVKIFAHAFAKSQAYFYAEPQLVCLTGAREWSAKYPLVHSVRLVEALEIYRANGLPLWQYLKCKNFALNNFIPEIGAMIWNRENSGIEYINVPALALKACVFPNFYLSPFRFLWRRIRKLIGLPANTGQ